MGSCNKKIAPLVLGTLLALLQGGAQASTYVDVLDLPAQSSALAARSPLLGVAQAGQRLVTVGQRGHILYSDDAGQNWQQADVPVSSDLTAVQFPFGHPRLGGRQRWRGVAQQRCRRHLEQAARWPPDRRADAQALQRLGQRPSRRTNNGPCWPPKASG